MDRPKLVTTIACIAAAILALLPAVLYRGHVEYDAQLAIYTVTFMGIAVYTLYQHRTLRSQESALKYAKEHDAQQRQQADSALQYAKEHDEQVRQQADSALTYAKEHDALARQQAEADARGNLTIRRANLATALLAELKMILVRTEKVVEHGPASFHNPIPHPIVTEAMTHTELFSADTVQKIAAVAFRLGDLERVMAVYRERQGTAREKESEAQRAAFTIRDNSGLVSQARHDATQATVDLQNLRGISRAHAKWAHDRIVPLVEALRGEGGIDPPPDVEKVIVGDDIPPLLANPFEARGDV